MCGVLGAVGAPDHADRWLRRHLDDLRHRGPDDRGLWQSVDRRVALGHRRLAVIDTTVAGHQPMADESGGHTIVFNGEIYNFVELRDELIAFGHRFWSESDTEVVLASYRQWGRSCVDRFVGMWAFALHDAHTDELWLSRDPFGVKPLFYVDRGGLLAFSSELPPLLDLTSREPDLQVAFDYLRWGHVDRSNRTFVDGVRHLGAGECMVVDCVGSRDVQRYRYWSPPARSASFDGSYDEACAEVRRLLVRSVELHLRSDVRVGAALSGGLDSSSIVMLMREVGGEALDVQTVSYLAGGSPVDETAWVREVNRASGAVGHDVRLSGSDVAGLASSVADTQFEPFGSLSILAQFAVFRVAAEQGLTVMLDGQGADELFAGYPSFRIERLVDLVRAGRFGAARRLAGVVRQSEGAGSVARALARALPGPVAVMAWRSWMGRSIPEWLDVAWFEANGVDVVAPAGDLSTSFDHAVEESQIASSLPGLLRYEDRNSMAHSIESRVPFLTRPLAEFAATLPAEFLLDARGRNKAVLLDAMAGLVPDLVLRRTDKVAFSVPQHHWMSSIDMSTPAIYAGIFRPDDFRPWSYASFRTRLEGSGDAPVTALRP